MSQGDFQEQEFVPTSVISETEPKGEVRARSRGTRTVLCSAIPLPAWEVSIYTCLQKTN